MYLNIFNSDLRDLFAFEYMPKLSTNYTEEDFLRNRWFKTSTSLLVKKYISILIENSR